MGTRCDLRHSATASGKERPRVLTILHKTPHYIAVDKPSGLLVHRTELSGDAENCLALVRDQLGQWVYPVHRLDRATSGVLLFALSSEAAEKLSVLVRERRLKKTYVALVRGHTPEAGEIDRPMRKNFEHKGSPVAEAHTCYRRLATAELEFAVGKYPTARYSLIEIEISTGRRHQIRRHMAHLSHPVIGDTVHGDGRHNRFFREQLSIKRLLLHASSVNFTDPFSGEELTIHSKSLADFLALLAPVLSAGKK